MSHNQNPAIAARQRGRGGIFAHPRRAPTAPAGCDFLRNPPPRRERQAQKPRAQNRRTQNRPPTAIARVVGEQQIAVRQKIRRPPTASEKSSASARAPLLRANARAQQKIVIAAREIKRRLARTIGEAPRRLKREIRIVVVAEPQIKNVAQQIHRARRAGATQKSQKGALFTAARKWASAATTMRPRKPRAISRRSKRRSLAPIRPPRLPLRRRRAPIR